MPPVPSRCPSLSSSTTSEPDEDDDNSTNNDAYPAARSRKIFRDTLKQFETHIDWHIAAIDEQLSKLTQNTLHTSVESTQPSTGSEFLDRVRRRRQEGWAERKRFNPKRYQDLREKALEEVDGQLRLTGSEWWAWVLSLLFFCIICWQHSRFLAGKTNGLMFDPDASVLGGTCRSKKCVICNETMIQIFDIICNLRTFDTVNSWYCLILPYDHSKTYIPLSIKAAWGSNSSYAALKSYALC